MMKNNSAYTVQNGTMPQTKHKNLATARTVVQDIDVEYVVWTGSSTGFLGQRCMLRGSQEVQKSRTTGREEKTWSRKALHQMISVSKWWGSAWRTRWKWSRETREPSKWLSISTAILALLILDLWYLGCNISSHGTHECIDQDDRLQQADTVCWQEELKQRKEQGLYGHTKCLDFGWKHQTSDVPPSWWGLQELTKISRCFCHWSEREMLAQQRKDSNLPQPSWADEPRILEQLSQNPTSTDIPCLRSLQTDSSEIFFCY